MILRALYNLYNQSDSMPAQGMEEREIDFLIVITEQGEFVRLEDCRIDKKHSRCYLVRKHVDRSSQSVADYLYDKNAYVLGVDTKEEEKVAANHAAFIGRVNEIAAAHPGNRTAQAIRAFYQQSHEGMLRKIQQDPLWMDIESGMVKKAVYLSFRIQGDVKIAAEQRELLNLDEPDNAEECSDDYRICLITGKRGPVVKTTSATMIPGSSATAKLVSFQTNSGYDSYGNKQCGNAPISAEAEFAYSTAFRQLAMSGSHNRFLIGERTFVFFSSETDETTMKMEENLFNLMNLSKSDLEDESARAMDVKDFFSSIYTGKRPTSSTQRFYILGLGANVTRLPIVHWTESSLQEFAGHILEHFDDMEIIGVNKEDTVPYQGVRKMLAGISLSNKVADVPRSLVEATLKAIFQGGPYPYPLYAACLRRLRAKGNVTRTRAAILKAYINRISKNNNDKLKSMLDLSNNNPGYLCGRLFAVLEKIQDEAMHVKTTIRDSYMNAASATPANVFSRILNLSVHHMDKLSEGRKTYFEKLKQEILAGISAEGFPSHLAIQDQGKFFVGYYHQKQYFFTPKDGRVNTKAELPEIEDEEEENDKNSYNINY